MIIFALKILEEIIHLLSTDVLAIFLSQLSMKFLNFKFIL